jgi:hypothetical protein
METKYKTTTVFDRNKEGYHTTSYCVVNTETKQIHSSWVKSIDAYRTMKDLNYSVKRKLA